MRNPDDRDWNPADPSYPVDPSQQATETSTLSASEEIAELRRQLQEKDEEARSNYDRFLRERAEMENFKRRLQREKTDAIRFACEPLIRDLLPVIDNLERALSHEDADVRSVRDGVRLVLESLENVLASHGVTAIDAVGQPFDPARHEALAQVRSDAHEPNQVVEQYHRGYLLHDRLLRPALVTVNGRTTRADGNAGDDVESGDPND